MDAGMVWFIGLVVKIVVVIIAWAVFGYPMWSVWAKKKEGEGNLAEANFERQIQVAEAQGRLDAADKNKQAAIIEAEAVAKQIEVIGNNLTKHDLYLRWQWIKMMEDRDGETIYVPTEANIPILEATRRS